MKPLSALRAGCAVGAVLVLVAGCSTSSADGPTSSPASATASASVVDPSTNLPTATPALPTPSVIGPPTPTSPDPAAQEAADRAAVEAVWADFWRVTDGLTRIAGPDRMAIASEVAVEPTLTQVLEQARSLDSKGREVYGASIFHPYWEQSINSGNMAVMGDCTDTSQSGARDISTGEIKTVGVPNNNTRATFVRGSDGRWRVEKIFYLLDVPCP